MAKKNIKLDTTEQSEIGDFSTTGVIVPSTIAKPCEKFNRDGCGLIEGVKYIYNEDHTVNWRAMIKPEHLVINRQHKDKLEESIGKKLNEINPVDLEDKYLLILLAGIKELAKIRGYNKVNYKIASAGMDYAGVICEIEWIPNFENQMRPVIFSALADASLNNTFSWASNYLLAIAENRAFVRCVRSYLSIHVVGHDEIGPEKKFDNSPETQAGFKPTEPHGVLQRKLEEKNKSFSKFKQEWIKQGHTDAEPWTGIGDIPIDDVWTILDAIKNSSIKKEEKD